jgi:hypothetical protein
MVQTGLICTTLTSPEEEMRIPKEPHYRDVASDTQYTALKSK